MPLTRNVRHLPDHPLIARWAGPALLVSGLMLLGVAWRWGDTPAIDWLLGPGLLPARLLPVIGLGLLCVRLPGPLAGGALLLWLAGALIGGGAHETLLYWLHFAPHAAAHEFYIFPLACLPLGLLLIAGTRHGRWPALVLAAFIGALGGVATRLTVPGFHAQAAWWLGIGSALWLLLGLTLTLQPRQGRWSTIATPIVGAWLIAIGLLYTAAGLVVDPTASTGPAPNASGIAVPDARDAFADFGTPTPPTVPEQGTPHAP
ncbi:hypothetical protein [Modicisalibacter coralii]|uniref:hypothetical protein n=1 Tax=Modicisalibacter coralii TaxID=2304602 RepID=UPI00100B89E3|nr:hypothetical protein [Halomonas coralii]